MFHKEAGISFLPRVWIDRGQQKNTSFLNKPTSFPALAQRRGNVRHSQRLGDTTTWLAPDEWGSRHLHQKSWMWEQPEPHRTWDLYTISAQCWERAQVPPYPRAASGEGSCNFAHSASCTHCGEAVHGWWNKKRPFQEEKKFQSS